VNDGSLPVGHTALSDVIRPLDRRHPNVAKHVKQYLRARGRFTFSEVSCYEILRGLRKKRAAKQIRQFIEFCGHAELLPVTYEVLDRAATLWADGQLQGKTIGDGDLMIAATAVLQSLPLVTSNDRHFEWIAGLPLFDWRKP
jgi:tRNA(fMet)-specific endonuclease VapC